MSALRKESCRDFVGSLGPYLDGELDTQAMLVIESHVVGCAACREEIQLLGAMRASLKRVVRASAPDGLRARMATAMAAERTRSDARDAEHSGAGARIFSWRTMVPLAGAAALALLWGAANRTPNHATPQQVAGVGGDDILSAFLDAHARPPGPVHPPKEVPSLGVYGGVPVRFENFERGGAALKGGRVLPVHGQRLVVLEGVVDSDTRPRTVSLMIYPTREIKVEDARLVPRAVGTAQVNVGTIDGWSVGVTQNGDIGCAMASDLDLDRTAKLVAMDCESP